MLVATTLLVIVVEVVSLTVLVTEMIRVDVVEKLKVVETSSGTIVDVLVVVTVVEAVWVLGGSVVVFGLRV